MELIKSCKPFSELSITELYAVLRLRVEVFVVEQNCVFQDIDNKDQYCHHVLLWNNDQLIAYARLVPANVSYTEPSIGRIITSSAVRGTGMGKVLVNYALQESNRLFGNVPVRIGAQVYAQKFYESFGFLADSEPYDEDGILHIEMIRK